MMYITCLRRRRSISTGNLDCFCQRQVDIPELKKTTRDEPDYDKLMKWRLGHFKGAWSWTEGNSRDNRQDRSASGSKRVLR